LRGGMPGARFLRSSMAASALEIHPAALEEFKSAVAWYLERSETAAVKLVEAVDQALEIVLTLPARWPTAGFGARKFVLQRFPFAIVYRERGEAVQILAIAHGNRRPGYWKLCR